MKRYLIKEILSADTYERIALVKRLSDNKEIFVYFLSHDDYVTDIKEIKSIKKGDILEGRLLIVFVCESIKINDKKNEQSFSSFSFKALFFSSNKLLIFSLTSFIICPILGLSSAVRSFIFLDKSVKIPFFPI